MSYIYNINTNYNVNILYIIYNVNILYIIYNVNIIYNINLYYIYKL